MKFSFIIPVFNAGKYIKECLKSILNQNMVDFEIICIDDCLTDNSLEILENFSQIDNRIVVHSNKKNMGAGFSRNIGLNYATGEYIAFVDADDWIENDFCNVLYNNAKTNDSDIVLFNAIEYNFNNTSRKRMYFPKNDINENEVFNYNYDKNLILNRFFVIWSKIYKREFIEKIRFHDLRIFDNEKSLVENKFIKYNTARIDLKNIGDSKNNLEISNISDSNANVMRPDWFKNDEGGGIIIESHKNNIDIELKCIGNGILIIKLRGKDVRNNEGERIPIYINCTEMLVNEKVIFKEELIWHDKPYHYQLNVKNNEVVKIHLEWIPF